MTVTADDSTTDDDTVTTGPLPALDLADGHLHLSSQRDVTVAAIDGGLDHELGDKVEASLASAIADATALILDLDQATLLDRDAARAVCDLLQEVPPGQRCIVAGRLSTRMVLERWGLPTGMVVFGSVADALQARTFEKSGYGAGWIADS